jgi:hypothetical protein
MISRRRLDETRALLLAAAVSGSVVVALKVADFSRVRDEAAALVGSAAMTPDQAAEIEREAAGWRAAFRPSYEVVDLLRAGDVDGALETVRRWRDGKGAESDEDGPPR